ncbi:hypothetical protein CAI16_11090 [Virgibacillus dokdonensis]|uniref:Crp/Fnr family transcriptional regulator n=1 Tax=Virgibacillus dokdonensis TaxID=302167 RepID=A0A2K9J8L4_9BACI|nr:MULTISPECIES: Crp/Fnr family transcriptional regulator [Virgibacillus]AUJ26100.1 Global nitrogen regulator [Virgibacillus dokdonensis]NWO13660.1 Crp/Fnr family transcriptional regulator [Virgibacillus sp.]RFA34567.1 hypothetical protein CAI16_11090 [Virgibacillus dokdonensis]
MIEKHPLLSTKVIHLFDRELRDRWKSRKQFIFEKGEQISSPYKQKNEIYLIIEGDVRIFQLHEDGKECVLGILTMGDFIDIASVFANMDRDPFAIALTKVTVVKVKKQEIIDAVIHTPSVSFALLKHFSNQLREVVGILEQVAYDKVEERLWRSLHKWKDEKWNHNGWHPLPKYLTHKDMAGMIASSRETVTFILNKWMNNGILKNERQQLWIKKGATL